MHNALRGSAVGNDTLTYFELFDLIAKSDVFSLKGFWLRYEPGYILFNKIISYISTNPQVLLLFSSIFIYSVWYKFIKRFSKLYWFSIFLLFAIRIIDGNMNILRQAIAMVIILCSYYHLRKKKLIKFVLTVICATCFHKSAFVFLFAYFVHMLKNVKINIKFITIFVIISAFAFVFTSKVLSFAFQSNLIPSYYLNSEYLEGGKIAPFINFVIFALLASFIYISKSYEVAEKDGIQDNRLMFMLLIIGILLSIVNLNFSIFSRISSYFTMFAVILLPNSLCVIKSKSRYLIYISTIFFFFVVYYFIIVTYRPYWIHVYPYEFFFNL